MFSIQVRTPGANLGERDAPRFHICVRTCRSSNGEEQAGDEAGTRDQRREDAHEGDAAAGGGTHYAGGCIDDMY